MTTTSLLHTALQNLHVAQQVHHPSHTPRPPSSIGSSRRNSSDEDDEEYVKVGAGTAPGTPVPGRGLVLGQRIKDIKSKDPLRCLPTQIAVRIFLHLDVKSLARCDRVCKRWNKSSTLNYVWFLQNRALILPQSSWANSGKTRQIDDGTEFFDPYDKSPRLASLPRPTIPTSTTPQWSKAESKRAWKSVFHSTLERSDPSRNNDDDPLHVDIYSLHSSGYSTPSGRHAYAGLGSGNASNWANGTYDDPNGSMTPSERKLAAREGYKALGGRKSRAKRKMGGNVGIRDKLVHDDRFDAPW